jgi:anti-sigma-K factor RskA
MYDDDRDALAAEYVLGTLSADEREQAEALLVIDPGFAEIVRVWERRLGELNVMVEAVEPPPDVWDKIQAEITGAQSRNAANVEAVLPALEEAVTQAPPETGAEEGELVTAEEPSPALFPDTEPEPEPEPGPESELEQPQDLDDAAAVAALASSLLPEEPAQAEKPKPAVTAPPPPPPQRVERAAGRGIDRGAEVIYLRRQARRWRGVTVVMSALAAVLALFVVASQLEPGLIPPLRLQTPTAPPLPPGSQLVAVLQQEPTAPAFLLTVDPQSRTMTVRRLTGAADPGRSYELWLIAGGNPNPHSLGLVGADEFTTRPLPADFDTDAIRAARYAVSLEPAGGSPSGAPTGPILFTGKMVQSVPGSSS